MTRLWLINNFFLLLFFPEFLSHLSNKFLNQKKNVKKKERIEMEKKKLGELKTTFFTYLRLTMQFSRV